MSLDNTKIAIIASFIAGLVTLIATYKATNTIDTATLERVIIAALTVYQILVGYLHHTDVQTALNTPAPQQLPEL